MEDGEISCRLGNCPVSFIVDSGSPINAITERDWDRIVDSGAPIENVTKGNTRKFQAYATSEPLTILFTFSATVTVNESKPSVKAEFVVVRKARKALLSRATSVALKLLKIGLDVQAIKETKHFPAFPNIVVKLEINPEVVPKQTSYYRIPAPIRDEVMAELESLIEQDIIELVEGPCSWISPLIVVSKSSGGFRLCVDMREANKAIRRENYPMPTIETCLNELNRATVFSKIDLKKAYHHVRLAEESRNITTFMTPRGPMRYKRLMFGVNCAPEIFQRIMCEMLNGCEGTVSFLDDIAVAGTIENHDERLQKVLGRLKSNNATLNDEKCRFRLKEIELLGFTVNARGIKPSESKVQAILKFREPRTIEEVRQFLGLVQFIGHFIQDLASKTEALRKMIRKEVQGFGREQKEAFEKLKGELANHVRQLGFYDPKDRTELYVDASPWGLGAALVQYKDGEARVVAFASKSLTTAERKYPQTQREALAVPWGVERFHFYLFGLEFTLFTDHKTLEFIFHGKHQTGKRACTRAEAWSLRLQPYHFTVKYLPGSKNIADPLSRLCNQEDKPFDEASELFLYAIESEERDLKAVSMEEIASETRSDGVLQKVLKAIESKNWPKSDPDLNGFRQCAEELGEIRGVMVRQDRIVPPASLRQRILQIAHRGHPGVVGMKRTIRERLWWPGLDRETELFVENCLGCVAVSKTNPPEPMCRAELPTSPWLKLGIDYLTVPECNTSFLLTVDYYSRYVSMQAVKETNASKTIEALERVFAQWSYPAEMRLDNGQPFASAEFKNYAHTKNIKLEFGIPYWPQMNGQVERQNRGVVRALQIGKIEKRKWADVIQTYVYNYNIRPHSVTGKCPLEVMTNRPVKDLLPSLEYPPERDDSELRNKDREAKEKGKETADAKRHARPSEIASGDKVFIVNKKLGKLQPNFIPEPYLVVRRNGNETIIRSHDGVQYRRCVTDLKRWGGVGSEVRKNQLTNGT